MGPTRSAVAAIDCGTNSTRLLIADSRGETLVREMRVTRLGAGVDATHRLAPAAVQRTLDVLGAYRKEMDAAGVGQARQVATSAVRDAENGAEFLEAASSVTGVEAELLSGLEEGRLSFDGATAGLEPASGHDVVVDVGGGSTELVAGRHGRVDPVSVDVGCVRLTERFLHHDPPKSAELIAARREVEDRLTEAERVVPALGALAPGSRLIGLAGTVSSLLSLDLGLVTYERDRVHHGVLFRSAVSRWRAVLAAEPAAERARVHAMTPGREDVIVGGAVILEAVMERFGFNECLVSESDILDGLVMSLRSGR